MAPRGSRQSPRILGRSRRGTPGFQKVTPDVSEIASRHSPRGARSRFLPRWLFTFCLDIQNMVSAPSDPRCPNLGSPGLVPRLGTRKVGYPREGTNPGDPRLGNPGGGTRDFGYTREGTNPGDPGVRVPWGRDLRICRIERVEEKKSGREKITERKNILNKKLRERRNISETRRKGGGGERKMERLNEWTRENQKDSDN